MIEEQYGSVRYRNKYSYAAVLITACIILSVITFYGYRGALRNSFVWDSVPYVYMNPYIRDINFENIKWMLTSFYVANWHPLTWISYAIDYKIYGGLSKWGFHLTNILLHILNTILVFILILKIVKMVVISSCKDISAQKNAAIISAFVGALVFGVHPQHVESVVWVAERKDLLCNLFILLTFLIYIKYVSIKSAARKKWYFFSLFAFLLALLSKPMAVTVPAVLMLLDYYPFGRVKKLNTGGMLLCRRQIINLIVEKVPFAVLAFIVIIITLSAQGDAITSQAHISLQMRLLNAVDSIFLYLRKFVFIFSYSPFYPHMAYRENVLGLWNVVNVAAFILVTIYFIYLLVRAKPYFLVMWLFFLITLSPVLGLVQVGYQGAADRYAYLPTLPLYILIGVGCYLLLTNGGLWRHGFIIIICGFVVFGVTGKTRQQTRVWNNELSLWSHAAILYPSSGFVSGNLGSVVFQLEDYAAAMKYFDYAYKKGQLLDAYLYMYSYASFEINEYRKSLMINLKIMDVLMDSDAYHVTLNCVIYNVGYANYKIGDYSEARRWIERVDKKSLPWVDIDGLFGVIQRGGEKVQEESYGYCRL